MLEEARRELQESQERAQSRSRPRGCASRQKSVHRVSLNLHPILQYHRRIPSRPSQDSLSDQRSSLSSSVPSDPFRASPFSSAHRASARLPSSAKFSPTTATTSSTLTCASPALPTSPRCTFPSRPSSSRTLPRSRTCSGASGAGASSRKSRTRSNMTVWTCRNGSRTADKSGRACVVAFCVLPELTEHPC